MSSLSLNARLKLQGDRLLELEGRIKYFEAQLRIVNAAKPSFYYSMPIEHWLDSLDFTVEAGSRRIRPDVNQWPPARILAFWTDDADPFWIDQYLHHRNKERWKRNGWEFRDSWGRVERV